MKQIMIPYEEYLLLEQRDKDYYSLELGFKEISKMYHEVKTKKEKAIEYIEKSIEEVEVEEITWVEMKTEDYIKEQQELLNILQGNEDNEDIKP